jgi:DNA-binding NtrC family response regulator
VAKDGEEVIYLYQQALKEGSTFDAVILDLTVQGGMGGKEAIKKLREIDPKVKAIVSSGYSNDPVMSNFRKYGFQEAVKKPYKIQDMSKALNSVLT